MLIQLRQVVPERTERHAEVDYHIVPVFSYHIKPTAVNPKSVASVQEDRALPNCNGGQPVLLADSAPFVTVMVHGAPRLAVLGTVQSITELLNNNKSDPELLHEQRAAF